MARPSQFMVAAHQAAADKSPDGWDVVVLALDMRVKDARINAYGSLRDEEVFFQALCELRLYMHRKNPARFPLDPPDR